MLFIQAINIITASYPSMQLTSLLLLIAAGIKNVVEVLGVSILQGQ